MVCHIFVFQLPNIDWAAYDVKIPVESMKPHTRKVSGRPTEGSLGSATNSEHESGDARSRILVRGRLFDDSKPETFNQVCTIQYGRISPPWPWMSHSVNGYELYDLCELYDMFRARNILFPTTFNGSWVSIFCRATGCVLDYRGLEVWVPQGARYFFSMLFRPFRGYTLSPVEWNSFNRLTPWLESASELYRPTERPPLI
jgi:hypothetical protein